MAREARLNSEATRRLPARWEEREDAGLRVSGLVFPRPEGREGRGSVAGVCEWWTSTRVGPTAPSSFPAFSRSNVAANSGLPGSALEKSRATMLVPDSPGKVSQAPRPSPLTPLPGTLTSPGDCNGRKEYAWSGWLMGSRLSGVMK
jgi:hypothetical protein